ncbi:mannosyl-oligosaccharide glucosidase [Ischnura elegans]|uniref:mannosyl-oligosaccharide glucosidase n=1 Tax=Ischnura elegans TaxID=197161 RepID=UPI001ED89F37|nr:mannosyl-oligosaccharide glucosidase [Ischnura elegans]
MGNKDPKSYVVRRVKKHKNITFENNEPQPDEKNGYSKLFYLTAVVGLSVAAYACYLGYCETRVNTPFNDRKVVQISGLDDPETYWGTYRPGVYFGMKTRSPYSPVMGLMWYFPRIMQSQSNNIRHWCEQGDNLGKYGWEEHDGRTFGVQTIKDGHFTLVTSFVKRPGGNHGGDWSGRIAVSAEKNFGVGEIVSLFFYTALEEKTKGWISPNDNFEKKSLSPTGVVGWTEQLGDFTLRYFTRSKIVQHSFLATTVTQLEMLKDAVISHLRYKRSDSIATLPGLIQMRTESGKVETGPNFIVTEITGRVPFEIEVVFESKSYLRRPGTLVGEMYDEELEKRRESFHQKFNSVFKLNDHGNWNKTHVKFAETVLSNVMGSIGYFYGSSRVISEYNSSPVPYWKAPLFTAVPSRSFFPRGFLWDEGFHGLLISAWDLDMELDIMCHWFDLMNVMGWIPREQILGSEALAKVPEEFVVQNSAVANPPTFFLTIQYILSNFGEDMLEPKRLATLERLYPRLQAWFNWLNTSQAGTLPGTYRWRGRVLLEPSPEINPKTLASGLDDFPRASHPTTSERHVDLLCWIALGAAALAEVAELISANSVKYKSTFEILSDDAHLAVHHWSDISDSFADYGLHTDSLILKRPPRKPNTSPHLPPPGMIRYVLEAPHYRYVDSAFGYVSLFPFFLQLLEKDSDLLGLILSKLERKDLLWTDYGLRSLSTTSPYYMQHNTEHDPPYWRGQIWININYLAVRALYHYGSLPGPYSEKAKAVYERLRVNVVNNVMKQYKKTGYIWEQYNDRTGAGMGSRPFTGWSSLVVLMMAELY